MKVTKLEHACLVIEADGGSRLVIDPGSYTQPLADLAGVVAVVVTHKHDDHCDETQLRRITAANPSCQIIGTAEVAQRLQEFQVTIARHGDIHKLAEFEVEFFGDLHQEIHRDIPILQNLGVLVNRKLYYPGDSWTTCDYPVDTLACPSSAPWLRISDVIEFLKQVKPRRCFATHNVLLSDLGHELQNGRIQEFTEAGGGEFRYLRSGDSWDI